MPRFEKKLVLAGVALSLVGFSSVSSRADDAATLYKSKCAMCHGTDGKGDTPAGKKMGVHDLGGAEVQSMKDADLSAIISDGKNKMPGYKKSLSADQIKDLVAYLRSFKK
jgi:mono/diheme cytochrome c family protein